MEYRGKSLRNELKFFINDLEYSYLKSRLKGSVSVDKNVNEQGVYHIRSLYLDDFENNSYYEKESGVIERKKYRIRIYNKSEKVIRLEKKEKFDKYISKTSLKISKEMYYNILKNKIEKIPLKKDDLLDELYLKMRIDNLRPVVIVDYIREPYIYKYGNVRITFDKNLQTVVNSCDIFNKSSVQVSPKLEGSMILEVKFDDYLPEFIRNELQLYRHQISAISKYTICRDLKNSLSWGEKIL